MNDLRNLRTGLGMDVHAFAPGRKLILGGVDIPHHQGLDGHSDADVLAHAISDALLGAVRGGDIGKLFPDTDPAYKDADSLKLLAEVARFVRERGFEIIDVDSVIAAGPFQYNTSTLRFYKNGREILLSSKENAMMKLFIDNVNRIFSKDMLYDLIWGEAIIDENAIMVYVNRLRQKIEEDPSNPQYIQTVRGLGYRFVV